SSAGSYQQSSILGGLRMSRPAVAQPPGAAAPRRAGAAARLRELDWTPLALVPLLALIAAPLVGSASTWLTLTVAGLAMGMIIFIIASGLTLVFGLMD